MTSHVLDIDQILTRMTDGEVHEGLEALFDRLNEARNELSAAAWHDAIAAVRRHPITLLMHQDPLTNSAYQKLRGYPGGADVIDYLYGLQPIDESVSPIGQDLYRLTFEAQAGRAVRGRLARLARAVDDACAQRPARVVSVACGHLREAALSKAYAAGQVAEWLALDQDPLSLDVIAQTHGDRGVINPMCVSVRDILKSNTRLSGTFDLIYAAGLFDYLPQSVATSLTEKLFELLAPGGRLLTANFLPHIRDVGYMEAFMDWWLVYRSQDELVATASSLPREGSTLHSDIDEFGTIAYLNVQKL